MEKTTTSEQNESCCSQGCAPAIGSNGNWFISGQDTGVRAQGEDGATPYVGINGNWHYGKTDTGMEAKGDKGEDGKGTYEFAVADGFEGDITQWLLSLKGQDGKTGVQGCKGDTGIQGPKGEKGDTGPQGIQGLKGDKGDTGIQGPKGAAGLQGPAGQTGNKGEPGKQGEPGKNGEPGKQGEPGKNGVFDTNSTITYTVPNVDTDMASGNTLPVLFGKIHKRFMGIKSTLESHAGLINVNKMNLEDANKKINTINTKLNSRLLGTAHLNYGTLLSLPIKDNHLYREIHIDIAMNNTNDAHEKLFLRFTKASGEESFSFDFIAQGIITIKAVRNSSEPVFIVNIFANSGYFKNQFTSGLCGNFNMVTIHGGGTGKMMQSCNMIAYGR